MLYLRHPLMLFFGKRMTLLRVSKSQGFSLIEIVVVIAVLAVLLAIALPNFFGIDHAARVRVAQVGLGQRYVECKISRSRGQQPSFSLEKLPGFTLVSGDNSVNYEANNAWINGNGMGLCHPSGLRVNPEIGGFYPEFIIREDGLKSCISGVPAVGDYWQLGCTGAANSRVGEWK